MIAHRHTRAHRIVYGHGHVKLIGAVWVLHHVVHLGQGEGSLQGRCGRVRAVWQHVHEESMVVQEAGVFLFERNAEVLELDELWSRSEVNELGVVVGEGESVVPRVLKRVVAD